MVEKDNYQCRIIKKVFEAEQKNYKKLRNLIVKMNYGEVYNDLLDINTVQQKNIRKLFLTYYNKAKCKEKLKLKMPNR